MLAQTCSHFLAMANGIIKCWLKANVVSVVVVVLAAAAAAL